jgi:adenylate kinase
MKKKRLGFNLILMGMIASGKETQTEILKKKYSLQAVETGVYTRNLLKEKSKNGEWARRTAGKGLPLPTILMQKFITSQIDKKPKSKDLIFIGGPRLKPEAQHKQDQQKRRLNQQENMKLKPLDQRNVLLQDRLIRKFQYQ